MEIEDLKSSSRNMRWQLDKTIHNLYEEADIWKVEKCTEAIPLEIHSLWNFKLFERKMTCIFEGNPLLTLADLSIITRNLFQ